ncbi:MAG: pantetheine-phosphate adenylyltransferase [Lachnospiraceae bacterium]|nr:pantetheine-phosphate adenylyltransferase [Lachnospiraceae bacterium]
MNVAIYPGSFDPLTLGHMDVIHRAASMFNTLLVSVLNNKEKCPLFSVSERVNILKEATKELTNVRVDSFSGLLVNYARENDTRVIIRGLRAITDFDYELQIAQTNRILSNGEVDTVFLTTSLEYAYLSSSSVRQIASFNGDISMCVLPFVAEQIYQKYGFGSGNSKSSQEEHHE